MSLKNTNYGGGMNSPPQLPIGQTITTSNTEGKTPINGNSVFSPQKLMTTLGGDFTNFTQVVGNAGQVSQANIETEKKLKKL